MRLHSLAIISIAIVVCLIVFLTVTSQFGWSEPFVNTRRYNNWVGGKHGYALQSGSSKQKTRNPVQSRTAGATSVIAAEYKSRTAEQASAPTVFASEPTSTSLKVFKEYETPGIKTQIVKTTLKV
jgi:hypothetical protein